MFNWALALVNPVLGTNANNANPVQALQDIASDQSLHCLLIGIFMENTVKVKIL